MCNEIYFVRFIFGGIRYIMDDIKDFSQVGIGGIGLRTKRFFTLYPRYPDTFFWKHKGIRY